MGKEYNKKVFWSNLESFTADKPYLWKIGLERTY